MRFSQRMGLAPVKTEIEKEGMSEELRNGLWSMFKITIADPLKNERLDLLSQKISEQMFYMSVWIEFLKLPVDRMPETNPTFFYPGQEYPIDVVRDWFYKAKWYDAFNFIEYCAPVNEKFASMSNKILAAEKSAYRFVDRVLVQINSEEEVVELENAIQNLDPTSPAREHLRQAMVLFSDRKNPDYRNSIKESISAIESLVKVLLEDEKATLGQALKRLEADHGLHPALKGAFDKLYGYTSDSGGIRHALKDGDVQVNAEEARFMLVTCSAFVNYLITKLN